MSRTPVEMVEQQELERPPLPEEHVDEAIDDDRDVSLGQAGGGRHPIDQIGFRHGALPGELPI